MTKVDKLKRLNNMKQTRLLSILIFLGILVQSCNLEPDVAPVLTFDGEANMTIAELLQLHTIGNEDSYDTIPAGTIITGIVTTSDEWGNNYKSINIEDGTGGILIKINNSALYNKYKVGQRVFVKCDGLHIGDYRKLPQLGIWVNGSMESIPNAKIYIYLYPDGSPKPIEPSIVLTTIPSANDIPATHYNRLVRLEGASFVEGGVATFSESSGATSRDIKMQDGTTITLRTSNYAKFASTILPTGTGNITGVLTRYNSTVQLVISSLDDLQNFTVPQTLQTVFSVDYPNAFNEGWIQQGYGNDWTTLTNSVFNGFYITPSDNQSRWLISPEINIDGTQSPEFSFTHRSPQGFSANVSKAYYTTNYTNDVNTTEWKPIDLSEAEGLTSQANVTIPIPAEDISSKFRIAFCYEGKESTWYISNIKVKAYK